MKIINVEGPIMDPQTFQPHLRITLDMPLEVSTQDRTEQENALIIYRAWQSAFAEWNQNKQQVSTP
jgi:hypothetical protein